MRLDDTRCKRHWNRIAMIFALLIAFESIAGAQPVYVVDTGAGSAVGGLSLTRNQFLAGQFTLDLGHELEALEGWIIYPTSTGTLPVYAVIYGDDDGKPDLMDEVYRQLFQVTASGFPLGADWHGASGFTLPIYGGTYWLAFEVPSDDFGSGAMPPTALQELDFYAIDSGLGYLSNTTARIGIRVLPEPSGSVALAAGIITLGWVRRRAHSTLTTRARHR